MDFQSWRGTIGAISPTLRPGTDDSAAKLMPEGIQFIRTFIGIRQGTAEEMVSVLDRYEEKAKELAELGVDYVNPGGAPPFMVHGFEGERKIIENWENQYGVPMFTSGMTQVEAMKALGVTKIVGLTYFRGEINEIFANYFRDAGVEVLAMTDMDIDFNRAQYLNSREVYGYARRLFLANQEAEGIYLLGAFPVLDIIDMLEADMRVPVLHAACARSWAVQHRLHIRQPIEGYGRLLREFPDPVTPLHLCF